jgi:tetratricopeptide (TPR) repeat protein
MKKHMSKLLKVAAISVMVASCAGPSFNNQIQKDQYDLLAEESFMRYNSNRLSALESPKRDFISLALIACHQRKMVKGQGLLEEKMHQNKTNPFYWNALGTCYYLSKDYTKSIFYYQLGLEATRASNKDYSDSQKKLAEAVISNNLGLIHLTFKRYNEAYDAFKKANSIVPNYFTPDFNMAQLYIEFNQNDKALDILKKLEAKNHEDIDLLYSLSLVSFKQNDMDKSFQYVSRIQHDYLNRADIVGIYAYNLMRKNRLVEAKEILEKRLFAPEYNKRNEMLLDEVKQKIKDEPEKKASLAAEQQQKDQKKEIK